MLLPSQPPNTLVQSLLVLIVFLSSISNAQSGSYGPSPNPALEEVRSKYHLPGLAAASISLKGRRDQISARAVGLRKIDDDALLTTKDQFYIASLTKAMTSTLIAMLINDGETSLTWNTTLQDALPHLENILPAHRDTTLAVLGAHLAGLDDAALIAAEVDLWQQLVSQTVTPTEGRRLVAERVFSLHEPSTPPGETFLYSNVGYMILGHLIDLHVPGGWEEFISDRIFEPLGMSGCGVGLVPQTKLPDISNPWPHAPGDPDPVPVPWDQNYAPALGPAGTVHCTMESYAKFLSFHVDGFLGRHSSLLPAEAFRVLHTPYTVFSGLPPTGDRPDVYSSGAWERGESSDVGRYLFHDGGNSLNQALGIIAPEVKKAFFVGTNVGSADVATHEVAEGLFAGTLGF